MAPQNPNPQLPRDLGPEWELFRQWCTAWVGKKLGSLPSALVATTRWNPGNVAFGASTSTTVSVPGARMGDPVSVGFTDEEAGVLFTGAVSSSGVVRVVLSNLSVAGSAFDMNAGTLTVIVWRTA